MPAATKREQRWNEMFQQLKIYKKRYGNCNVPKRKRDANNKQLAQWVHTQRQTKKEEKMSDARKRNLDAIGFTWSIGSIRWKDDLWNQRFEELKDYKKQFGHCNVPWKYKANPQLGTWVAHQRSRTSNERRRAKLESIGFEWSVGSSGGKPKDH